MDTNGPALLSVRLHFYDDWWGKALDSKVLKIRAKAIEKYGLGLREELSIVERRNIPGGAGLMSRDSMKRYNQEICEMAGIQFIPHDQRRTCGKRLRKAGLSIETVAKCLRQENINTAFRAHIRILPRT